MARIRLAHRETVAATQCCEERHQPQSFQNRPRRGLRLVGADGQPPAFVAQRRQRLNHAGIKPGENGRVFGIIGQEFGHRAGICHAATGSKSAVEQGFNTIAHHASHGCVIERILSARQHQAVEGSGQVRHGIHQRAVQIEHNALHHNRLSETLRHQDLPGFPALPFDTQPPVPLPETI